MKNNQEAIQDIRAFNRFYTVYIGLLDSHLLDSDYSLAEVRVLYEINAGKQISASQIINTLNIDKGYMSRILKKFEKDGLVAKKNSESDARVSLLTLTDKGLNLFSILNEASNKQINDLIGKLPHSKQQELAGHMKAILKLLNE